jgi:hypothetical protein
MPTLDVLLNNVNRARENKKTKGTQGKGRSLNKEKIDDFYKAVEKLNSIYGTQFYMETSGKTYTIQGNREYGHLSRRNGIIGVSVHLTLALHEMDAGTENTIKMIVDNNGGFLVVSLSKMRELGLFSEEVLRERYRARPNNTIPYYTWNINELCEYDVIMYLNN